MHCLDGPLAFQANVPVPVAAEIQLNRWTLFDDRRAVLLSALGQRARQVHRVKIAIAGRVQRSFDLKRSILQHMLS